MLPWTIAIVAGVAFFFAFLLVFIASPFATQMAPVDGAGMNPSLQNPYMIAHPPMLYLGYVGLTIPFAFAMAALASRQVDERWIVVTRRWTLRRGRSSASGPPGEVGLRGGRLGRLVRLGSGRGTPR